MNTEKANRSVYLIDIKLDNEKSMLIHGYTGAIDIVSNELADYLKNNPCISTHDFPFSNNTLNSLLNRGYLTTKTKEEEYSVTSKIANLLHDAHKRMYKSFAFIITYNCNFRCPYCFENSISGNGNAWSKKVFTPEMADKAYEAMLKIETRRELHNKQILLYGGEPLLKENKDIVSYIVQKGHKLGYQFRAITNGYDLDEYIDLLSPELINTIQITLDGYKKYHNSRRKHISDINTFDKIIKNIGLALSQHVNVTVRINTEENNFEDLAKLCNLFNSLGYKGNPYFHFYSSMLRHYNTTKEENEFKYLEWNQFIKKHYTEDKEEITCQDHGWYKRLYNCLKHHKSFQLLSTTCYAQYGNYMFDPQGCIFTCLETIGKKEHIIGFYDKRTIEWTKAKQFWQGRTIATTPRCKFCKYALLCGGGCLNKAPYTNSGFGISACTGFPFILEKSARKAFFAFSQHM